MGTTTKIEGDEAQAADAAAAREAAKAAALKGEPTEADLQVERDQKLDEAKAKAAEAAKAAEKAKAAEAAKAAEKAKAKDATPPVVKPAVSKDAPAEGEAEAALYAEPDAEARQWALDSYGAPIATAMDKAGINPVAANAYYQEHGKLPESAFKKLEEAGYPRAMVGTYLDGVKATKTAAVDQGAALAAEVTKLAGGKPAYERMTTWATQGGMTKAELDDFNAVIDSKNPGALRLAVKALRARYEQVHGRLPKTQLTGARTATALEDTSGDDTGGGDVFKSTSEIAAAQRDPKWQRDPAYRKAVEQKIVRSNLFGKARKPSPTR